MILTIGEVRDRPTISVPEAGHLLGIGRDAAYEAASRGQIPVLRLGRSLRVPVPALLALLGVPQTGSEPAPASAGTAPILRLPTEENDRDQRTPPEPDTAA